VTPFKLVTEHCTGDTVYCTSGLLTLTLQFEAKIFQLGRATIRDWWVRRFLHLWFARK